MSAANFVAKFNTFVNLIVSRVKKVDSASMYIGTGTIGAGATVTIDLKPLLPAGTTITDYYIQTVLVDLKFIDVDDSSVFKGQAVPASAYMSYGITDTGILSVKNYYTASVTYWLRVLAPAFKPT